LRFVWGSVQAGVVEALTTVQINTIGGHKACRVTYRVSVRGVNCGVTIQTGGEYYEEGAQKEKRGRGKRNVVVVEVRARRKLSN
jgi:hypothetical protein